MGARTGIWLPPSSLIETVNNLCPGQEGRGRPGKIKNRFEMVGRYEKKRDLGRGTKTRDVGKILPFHNFDECTAPEFSRPLDPAVSQAPQGNSSATIAIGHIENRKKTTTKKTPVPSLFRVLYSPREPSQ